LTRIAIHILVKKGELLIWRKNGHFPHSAAFTKHYQFVHKAQNCNFLLIAEKAYNKLPAAGLMQCFMPAYGWLKVCNASCRPTAVFLACHWLINL
jgi:hypothetical protein